MIKIINNELYNFNHVVNLTDAELETITYLYLSYSQLSKIPNLI